MDQIQIIVHGAAGRMGREIIGLIVEQEAVVLLAGIDYKGRSNAKSLEKIKVKKNAVVIDFSTASGMKRALDWCKTNRVPFVSGTTGLSLGEKKALQAASAKIPVLWSPNMSFGVNLFMQLIESMGSALRLYDLQLEEFHHAKKKDSPSGTAKLLQEAVERAGKVKMPPVLVGRGGGLAGLHKLLLMGQEEVLTIEHTALNRAVFARGAIQAAQWLQKRKPGLYSMRDVLSE